MVTLKFFLPQILLGLVLGATLSVLGSILILRKKAFFGVTLSQVISSVVAISLFFNFENHLFIVALVPIVILPILFLFHLDEMEDSVLAILFVSFTAFTQILLNFGGNVKNQIMASYYGDILTSQVKLNFESIFILLISLLAFVYIYPKLFFLSFDKVEYISRNKSYKLIELIYFSTLILIITITINLLGSFYSIAHLVIPSFVGLFFARSMKFLFLFGICFSIISTLAGFLISLYPFQYKGEEIYFPTSSAIILLMSIFSSIILLFHKLKKRFNF